MANNHSFKAPNLTALIIARNEESMIANCLETLRWCQEIIVLDNGSTDTTAELATELGARVVHFQSPSFATLRDEILKYAKTDWVMYLDADERVTPELAQEIMVQIETATASAFTIKRLNYFYGQVFHFTGTQRDQVTRVFKRTALSGWTGIIHESPKYQGKTIPLKYPLLHFTHRTTKEGLEKSAAWTHLEAELLFKSQLSPVTFLTILRKGGMEFFRRAVRDKGYQDGLAGLIEALIQAINRMIVYIQVWELQQQPSISKRYQELEKNVAQNWHKASS